MNCFKLTALLLLITTLTVNAQTDTALYPKQEINAVVSARLHHIKGEKQYLTGDLIRRQNLTRISDMLAWIDKATISSVNGDRFTVNINGAPGTMQQQLLVMVNGIRVEMIRLDGLDLDLLGISVARVAYVEILNTPQLVNGQLFTSGAINIVTRNDYKGLTAQIYSGYNTTFNHQKKQLSSTSESWPIASPTIQPSLGYYGQKGHIHLSYMHQEFYIRDTVTSSAYKSPGYTTYATPLDALRMESSINIKRTLLELGAAGSKQKAAPYTFFVNDEMPSTNTYKEITTRITHVFHKGDYVQLTTGWQQQENKPAAQLTPQKSTLFSHQLLTLEGGHKLVQNKNKPVIKAGYTFEYFQLNVPTSVNNTQHKPYVSLSSQPDKKTTREISTSLLLQAGGVFPAVVYNSQHKSNIISGSGFTLAWQSIPYNNLFNPVWYYYQQLSASGVSVPINPRADAIQHFSANYFKKLNFGTNVRLTFQAGLQHNRNLPIILLSADSMWAYNKDSDKKSITASPTSLMGGVNIHYDVFNHFWFDIDYFYTRTYSASVALNKESKALPRHKVALTMYYRLPARFELSGRFQASSATRWYYYDLQHQFAQADLLAPLIADLTLSKRTWGDRLWLSAGVHNLFGYRALNYPSTYPQPARYFITLQLKFEQLFKNIRKP